MKKSLLLITAVLLAFPCMRAAERTSRTATCTLLDECPDFYRLLPARVAPAKAEAADGSYNFSYLKSSNFNAYSFRNVSAGDVVYQVVEVRPEVLKAFADTKITAISTVTGINTTTHSNPDVDVTVFLSHGLDQTPFYTQKATRTAVALATDVVTLTTPQAVDPSKPLYIGYYFALNSQSQFVLPFDQVPTSDPSGYYAISTDGKLPPASEWENIAPEVGSIGVGCTFTGTIPALSAFPSEVSAAGLCKRDAAPNFSVRLRNLGTTSINSMTFHIEADGETGYDVTYDSNSVCAGAEATVSLTGHKFTSTGNKDVRISIATLNGKPNPNAATAATVSITVADRLVQRVPLYEIATGTWCGWCPRSLVALEYIHSDYEGKAIGIAYHSGDQLANVYSNTWMNYVGVGGLPSAYMNRTSEGAQVGESTAGLKKQLDETIAIGSVSEARINDFALDADGKNCTVNVDFSFTADVKNANIAVSMVVLEDNLGPYDQTNYYASGSYGNMFGWGSASNPRSYTYDDICRYMTGTAGDHILSDEDAVLAADKDYPYSFRLNLDNLASKGADPKFRVVAVIADARTGEVLNAAQKSFVKAGVSDITGDSDKPVIETAGGTITVSGARNVAVYSLSGVRVATGATATLPAGLYIVRADGHTAKVLVK